MALSLSFPSSSPPRFPFLFFFLSMSYFLLKLSYSLLNFSPFLFSLSFLFSLFLRGRARSLSPSLSRTRGHCLDLTPGRSAFPSLSSPSLSSVSGRFHSSFSPSSSPVLTLFSLSNSRHLSQVITESSPSRPSYHGVAVVLQESSGVVAAPRTEAKGDDYFLRKWSFENRGSGECAGCGGGGGGCTRVSVRA